VTGALPSKATVKMPSLPFGDASFDVDARDFPALVAALQASLTGLEQDPHMNVTLADTAPREPQGATTGCFTKLRRAWREARG
jgi:hypothetical protein